LIKFDKSNFLQSKKLSLWFACRRPIKIKRKSDLSRIRRKSQVVLYTRTNIVIFHKPTSFEDQSIQTSSCSKNRPQKLSYCNCLSGRSLPEGPEIEGENEEQGEQCGALANVAALHDSIWPKFLLWLKFR